MKIVGDDIIIQNEYLEESGELVEHNFSGEYESGEIVDIEAEYLFPNSDKELIDANNVAYLTKWELDIAKNEIFARYGHDFSSKDLKEYFNSKSWYKPETGKKVSVSELNKIEQKNVAIIDEEINSRKPKTVFENETLKIMGAAAPADAWYTYSLDQIVNFYTEEDGKFVIQYTWNSEVRYYINENIVSLLVIAPFENGVDCYVFNIDINQRKEISDEILLEYKQKDYKDYLEKVRQITLNYICSEDAYNEIEALYNDDSISYEDKFYIMENEYGVYANPGAILGAYEEELEADVADGTSFYLNENGDICYVRLYSDYIGSQRLGAYMYNIDTDEFITEFGVYFG